MRGSLGKDDHRVPKVIKGIIGLRASSLGIGRGSMIIFGRELRLEAEGERRS
jgi:hypothetical protein